MRQKPPPPSLMRPEAAEFDWHEFHARFSPDSRRHDSDALAAYESYRNSRLPRAGRGKRDGREEMQRAPAPYALRVWEWEGGAGPERSRPPAVPL
jgi:hypothetical protein